jgi:hypothetical protein
VRRPFATAVAITAGLALALGSCTLLNPLDGYTGGSVIAVEGGGASDPPGNDASTNELRRPPPRPTRDDPGESISAFTLAFDQLAVANTGPGATGYDLDGQNTCNGGAPSCTRSAACDGPQGIDNALAPLFSTFSAIAGPSGLNADPGSPLRRGRATLLLRIRDWNGKANDTSVTVGLFYSFGTDGSQDAGTAFWNEDAGTLAPKGDGTDVWTYDPTSLFGGQPRIVDPTAYVSNNTLVVSLPNFAVVLGSMRLTMQDGILTGRLASFPQTGGHRIVEGVLQGRQQLEDALTELQVFRSPLPPFEYLCRDSATYGAIREQLCKGADLRVNPKEDGTGLPCNALSQAYTFSAIPAIEGPPFEPPPPQRHCDDLDAGAAGVWIGRCP